MPPKSNHTKSLAKRSASTAAASPRALALAPAQAKALRFLENALSFHPFAYFWGRSGVGKTTILRQLQQKLGGVLLSAADFVDAALAGRPQGLEESFQRALTKALDKHPLVIIDGIDQLDLASHACGGYPRSTWWHTVFQSVVAHAERRQRRLVLSTSGGNVPHYFTQRAYAYGISKFDAGEF